MQPLSSVPNAARRGQVVERLVESNSVTLAIEFDSQRCKNCSCSFSAFGGSAFGGSAIGGSALEGSGVGSAAASPDNHSQLLRFSLAPMVDHQRLAVGQNVLVSLPASCLRATTAVMFGAPLTIAILSCAVAASMGLTSATQGLLTLAGFALGGWVSFCVRDRLQQRFYERLSVTPLDC